MLLPEIRGLMVAIEVSAILLLLMLSSLLELLMPVEAGTSSAE